MDINVLDKRLKAFEKKFRNLELYVRSAQSRLWWRGILVALVVAGVAAAGYYAYQFLKLSNERVNRIDMSLAQDFPSVESPYCRWIYGQQPDQYDTCLAHEQKSYTHFGAAWERSKAVPDLREQLIRCYASAQNESGMSWRTAAECAEIDDDLPESEKR